MTAAQTQAARHWLARAEGRAGPLVAKAECFVKERLHSDLLRFAGGPTGMLALAEALERWLAEHETDLNDEDRIIEQAGALLGLMLIGNIDSARHVRQDDKHCLALGRHGFFDPFAAIDRALDADDLRSALAGEIRRAEQEALGTGAISRVVAAFCERLAIERPHLAVVSQFGAKLSLRGAKEADALEIDLARVVEATHGAADETLQAAVRRFCSMLPGAPDACLLWDDARARIIPRLSRNDMLDAVARGQRPVLYRRPLEGELSVAFLIEHEGRARYLKASEARAFAVSGEEIEAAALDNLLARSSRFCLAAWSEPRGGFLYARTGDGRDSARLLLEPVRAALRQRLGPDLWVAIPHRDTFFACAAADHPARAAMAQRTKRDRERAPHGLTSELFRLRGPAAQLGER